MPLRFSIASVQKVLCNTENLFLMKDSFCSGLGWPPQVVVSSAVNTFMDVAIYIVRNSCFFTWLVMFLNSSLKFPFTFTYVWLLNHTYRLFLFFADQVKAKGPIVTIYRNSFIFQALDFSHFCSFVKSWKFESVEI